MSVKNYGFHNGMSGMSSKHIYSHHRVMNVTLKNLNFLKLRNYDLNEYLFSYDLLKLTRNKLWFFK